MNRLKYFFSHSIFVALGAAGLSTETFLIFRITPFIPLLFFIFIVTVNCYNLYWFLGKYSRSEITKNGRQIITENLSSFVLFFSSAMFFVVFLIFNRQLITVTAVAAVLTGIYTMPLLFKWVNTLAKPFGFLKTILLAFTWAFVTVFIPAVFMEAGITNSLLYLFIHRFLFLLLISIIFDYRDTSIDTIRGLHSLATAVNKKTLIILFAALMLLFAAFPYIFPIYGLSGNQKMAFGISSVWVSALFILSLIKKRGYFFYYFLVDGSMILSPLLTYLTRN